jgi:hypothetical protein
METLSSAMKKAEPAIVEDNWLQFDVPDGWTLCTMGDVCEVVGGGTPKASDPDNFSPDGHPWITPADLSGFTEMYVARGARSLSDRGLQSCSARLLPPGTVLMSSRAPIGYLAIAANEVCTIDSCTINATHHPFGMQADQGRQLHRCVAFFTSDAIIRDSRALFAGKAFYPNTSTSG